MLQWYGPVQDISTEDEKAHFFSSFDFDCRSWCDAAAIDCYLKNAIAAQLLGIIIHKTHGEDLYIIDKFPKAGCQILRLEN